MPENTARDYVTGARTRLEFEFEFGKQTQIFNDKVWVLFLDCIASSKHKSAKALEAHLRKMASGLEGKGLLVYRWGGDEFLCLDWREKTIFEPLDAFFCYFHCFGPERVCVSKVYKTAYKLSEGCFAASKARKFPRPSGSYYPGT